MLPNAPTDEIFYGVDVANIPLYVPAESIELYKNADQWKDFGQILPIDDFNKSLVGLMLKLKLQYFGHLMRRTDSFEKEFTVADIQAYNQLLDTLPHRELICGFVSGKDEILNWEPADLFQFYNDTTPIIGSLDELLPKIDGVAIDRAIKIGACNIYHGCVHNMLHTKNEDILKGLYKAASFVVQAIVLKQTGNYIKHQNQLLQAAIQEEKVVIETFLRYKNGEAVDFATASAILFEWSKTWISK